MDGRTDVCIFIHTYMKTCIHTYATFDGCVCTGSIGMTCTNGSTRRCEEET